MTDKNTTQNEYYTSESIVSIRKERINELVSAHWNYMKNVLSIGQNKEQTFTWEEMMAIREWDYTSVAKHFFGHGYEEAIKEMDEHYAFEAKSAYEDIRKEIGKNMEKNYESK